MSVHVSIAFPRQCQAIGLPLPEAEYRFHSTRRWRFDFAWVAQKVALEVEGGVWIRGRHSRGKGMIADMEKYNTASSMGWSVLRVTPHQITNGAALTLVESALKVDAVGRRGQ